MKSATAGLAAAAFLLVGVCGWVGGMPHAAPLRSPAVVALSNPPTAGDAVSAADVEAASTGQVELTTSGTLTVTPHTLTAVDSGWTTRVSAETGIPARALRAYAGAALDTAADTPRCDLGWNTLAAIGFVESAHGTIRGASIGDDGRPTSAIVGVALDGIQAAKLPDSDGGAIDGDSTVDRAVGPMQFIPDSWKRHGVDGDGDGIADPNQIDDAALTAAKYLCVSGDLSSSDAWRAAILSYNADPAYADRVAAKADAYAAAAG